MINLKNILRTHQERYPLLEAVDLVKLIYQNEFGNGHFIQDEGASLARLKEETRLLRHDDVPLFETIGNGLVRLHLGALGGRLPMQTVNRFFVLTAAKGRGSVGGFEQKLEVLKELCQDRALDSFLEEYRQAGYPPMSHSPRYREQYAPSYRVVSSDFALYYPVFTGVDELLRNQKPITVAIDGRSGSGKSYLAKLLHDVYGCPVISMDHFFLQPKQRTKKRLGEPGGNIDYERFQREVLTKLKGGDSFSYRIYDCQEDNFLASPVMSPHPLTIVEGSYSHHPALAAGHDLKVFLTVHPDMQKSRLLKRNGPVMLERFIEEWIPLEELYFSSLSIPEQSDIFLDTGDEPGTQGKKTP